MGENKIMKQTAVEWLEKEIYARGPVGENVPTWLKELYEQAKAMEREQHGETWDAAIKAYRDRGHNVVRAIVDFDEYWAEKSKPPPGAHCEEA